MPIISRLSPVIATCFALALAMPSADATTVDFTYSGNGGTGCSTCTTTGTGSFSFAGTPASVSLSDLTRFSLVDDFGSGNTSFTYGLGDLASFAATFDAAADVLTLSLATEFITGVGPNNIPEALIVTSLGDAKTFSQNQDVGEPPFNITVGTVTATTERAATVPEPATLALAGVALAGLGWSRRRAGWRASMRCNT